MMKFRLHICFSLLAVLLIVFSAGTMAQAAVILNNSGSQDPQTGDFSRVWTTGFAFAGTDEEDFWGISTPLLTGDSGYLGSFPGDSALPIGWTASMRTKVITPGGPGDATMTVITGTSAADPGWNWAIDLQADGVHAFNIATGQNPLIYAMNPADGYHDYQMVWDGNEGNGANGGQVGVFVDGVFVSTLETSQMFVNWGEQLRWGDTNSLSGAGADVESRYSLMQFDTGQLLTIPIPPFIQWAVDSSGDWDNNASWAPGESPNANVTTVIFGNAINSPRTVSTESAVTVKGVSFGDSDLGTTQFSYAIAGNGSVNLESDTGTSLIEVTEGSHQFQVVVNLANATTVDVTSGASVAFNNALNLGVNNLTKTGTGTMQINNALNTGGGVVSAVAGVVSGSGLISGNLDNTGATVAPGNSPGVLSVAGDYSQSAGVLSIEIGGTNDGSSPGGREFDLLNVTGALSISGGSLDVILIDGFVPLPGDTFDILDFGSINLSGATLNLAALSAGLLWDSSQLAVDGSLSVASSVGLPGDFDTDGDVDGNDFLAWQRGFGTSFDSNDLTDWEGNFGAAPLSAVSGATAAVPEPTSASLLIISLGALALVGRRRK